MSVTIGIFTSRQDPRFDWFCDALARQMTPHELSNVEVILIDRHLWFPSLFRGAKAHTEWIDLTDPQYHDPSRLQYGRDCVKDRFAFLHLPPKPCIWQGPWRITSKDWFCAANSRNTAFLYATHKYFVGIDDLAIPMPGWWNAVKHAAEDGYCVCGAYKKVLNLVIDNGEAKSWADFPPGVDSRWSRGSDEGIVKWSGHGMFGCSFGVPLDLALKIDGFDPACNGLGCEDYDFGIRAERAGGEFKYNRNMLTLESEEGHHLDPSLPRESRLVTNDAFVPRGYEGSRMSDHVLTNRVIREHSRIQPLIPEHLAKQRQRLEQDGMVNVPREPLESWIDKKPLAEL